MKLSTCPNCGRPFLTKTYLTCEILKMIGYKGKREIYALSSLNTRETKAIYDYLKGVKK